MNSFFSSVLGTTITASAVLSCTAASIVLGAMIAAAYMFRNRYTKSFVVTIATLPAMVQIVIMLVNGNIGTGVAVAGAFSLVRFRSAPGSAREISSIFLAMAVGLATGVGYIGVALLFAVVMIALNLFYTVIRFGESSAEKKALKITIPESLDYTNLFDDLFATYTDGAELIRVKTANLGAMYQLSYEIVLKDPAQEKAMLDEIRCRNGNLDIICGRLDTSKEAL